MYGMGLDGGGLFAEQFAGCDDVDADPAVAYRLDAAEVAGGGEAAAAAVHACARLAGCMLAHTCPVPVTSVEIDLRKPKPWGVCPDRLVDGLNRCRKGPRPRRLWTVLIWRWSAAAPHGPDEGRGAVASAFRPVTDAVAEEAVAVSLLWIDADARTACHWEPYGVSISYVAAATGETVTVPLGLLLVDEVFADTWTRLDVTYQHALLPVSFPSVFEREGLGRSTGPYAAALLVLLFAVSHALPAVDPCHVVMVAYGWAARLNRAFPRRLRVLLVWWFDGVAGSPTPRDVLAAVGFVVRPPADGWPAAADGCVAWTEGDAPCGGRTQAGWRLCAAHRRRLVRRNAEIDGPAAPFGGAVVPPLDDGFALWQAARTAPDAMGLRPVAPHPPVDGQTRDEHFIHCNRAIGGIREIHWNRLVEDVTDRVRCVLQGYDLAYTGASVIVEPNSADFSLPLSARYIRSAVEKGVRVLWFHVRWVWTGYVVLPRQTRICVGSKQRTGRGCGGNSWAHSSSIRTPAPPATGRTATGRSPWRIGTAMGTTYGTATRSRRVRTGSRSGRRAPESGYSPVSGPPTSSGSCWEPTTCISRFDSTTSSAFC